MEKIFYTDISDVKLAEINLSNINTQRLDKVSLLSDELKKIQSLTSYLLLRYAFAKLNINLNEYRFSYKNNKPYIEDFNYHFNITHSKNIIAVAISEKEVGIDAEYVDYHKKLDLVIKYALTNHEYAEFIKLTSNLKHDYFFQKWVIKEAHFKMIGIGLTKEFKDISLNYNVVKLNDSSGNQYYLASTIAAAIEKIDFNTINN